MSRKSYCLFPNNDKTLFNIFSTRLIELGYVSNIRDITKASGIIFHLQHKFFDCTIVYGRHNKSDWWDNQTHEEVNLNDFFYTDKYKYIPSKQPEFIDGIKVTDQLECQGVTVPLSILDEIEKEIVESQKEHYEFKDHDFVVFPAPVNNTKAFVDALIDRAIDLGYKLIINKEQCYTSTVTLTESGSISWSSGIIMGSCHQKIFNRHKLGNYYTFFHTDCYRYGKSTAIVKINDQYNAVLDFKTKTVRIGCQTFKFSLLYELKQAITRYNSQE